MRGPKSEEPHEQDEHTGGEPHHFGVSARAQPADERETDDQRHDELDEHTAVRPGQEEVEKSFHSSGSRTALSTPALERGIGVDHGSQIADCDSGVDGKHQQRKHLAAAPTAGPSFQESVLACGRARQRRSGRASRRGARR